MRWKLVLALTLASTATFGADCSRDFSGEWTQSAAEGAPDAAYRAEGSGWSERIRVVQDASRFTIESFYFAKTDMQPPIRFTYLPGQGATENLVMVGQGAQKQTSTARWSDCRLVSSTDFAGDDATAGKVTQTLWLESGSLVVETARGSAAPNRTIYRKAAVAGGT